VPCRGRFCAPCAPRGLRLSGRGGLPLSQVGGGEVSDEGVGVVLGKLAGDGGEGTALSVGEERDGGQSDEPVFVRQAGCQRTDHLVCELEGAEGLDQASAEDGVSFGLGSGLEQCVGYVRCVDGRGFVQVLAVLNGLMLSQEGGQHGGGAEGVGGLIGR